MSPSNIEATHIKYHHDDYQQELSKDTPTEMPTWKGEVPEASFLYKELQANTDAESGKESLLQGSLPVGYPTPNGHS